MPDADALSLEKVERAALKDLFDAATPALKDHLGLEWRDFGDGSACIASHEPSIVINRAIGLGLEGGESKKAVTSLVEAYKKADVKRFFLHVHPEKDGENLRQWATEAGLEKARGWMKFKRDTKHPAAPQTDLDVREIDQTYALDFARIVAYGFDLQDASVPWLANLVGRPKWKIFMTFEGDTPAGAGALYIENGIAWSDWGATHPDFRKRGGQTALLCHRIKAAAKAGCRMIGTATGEDVPGDPQHSYRNIQKVGFKEAFLRENYQPPQR